jgi:hypothetical protein
MPTGGHQDAPQPSEGGAKRRTPKRARAKQPAAEPAPDAGVPLYLLHGGGRGQGKQAYSGRHATFVGQHVVDGVCTGRCDMQLPGGERITWTRTHLRALLPSGAPAEKPPSWAALMMPVATARALRAMPDVPIVVLLDIEARGGTDTLGPRSRRIRELSAVALQHVGAGWEPCRETLSLRIQKGAFAKAARTTIEWLQALAPAAAEGSQVCLLAHNGPYWDWPILTAHLTTRGMELPACVSLLGCSRVLFVSGKEEVLQRLWNMSDVYRARFGRDVPNAHTAEGDVR